jgi:hypothetical protein
LALIFVVILESKCRVTGETIYTMAERTASQPSKQPPRRLSKEELMQTHKSHLKKQELNPNAPRPVKQPLLSEAYPASTQSIHDLELVKHPIPRPSNDVH